VHLYKHFEEKWAMEKSSLLSQIELFNDQIQSFQKKYEMIETDNRRMIQVRQREEEEKSLFDNQLLIFVKQDIHNFKQSNAMLNERLSILMKRATAASDANQVLTSRLSSVEKERDGYRSLVEMERQKTMEMTKIAEIAKIETANKELLLQK
jgi:hypothetical protein